MAQPVTTLREMEDPRQVVVQNPVNCASCGTSMDVGSLAFFARIIRWVDLWPADRRDSNL